MRTVNFVLLKGVFLSLGLEDLLLPETLFSHLEEGYKLKCYPRIEKQVIKDLDTYVDGFQKCQKRNFGPKASLNDGWDRPQCPMFKTQRFTLSLGPGICHLLSLSLALRLVFHQRTSLPGSLSPGPRV